MYGTTTTKTCNNPRPPVSPHPAISRPRHCPAIDRDVTLVIALVLLHFFYRFLSSILDLLDPTFPDSKFAGFRTTLTGSRINLFNTLNFRKVQLNYVTLLHSVAPRVFKRSYNFVASCINIESKLKQVRGSRAASLTQETVPINRHFAQSFDYYCTITLIKRKKYFLIY